MSYWNCDNPRDHERDGERDFERGGRYGYNPEKYNDFWDDCNKAYRDGFDAARREQDRRDELREEQEAEQRAEAHRVRGQEELEFYWAEQQAYAEYEAEQEQATLEEPSEESP